MLKFDVFAGGLWGLSPSSGGRTSASGTGPNPFHQATTQDPNLKDSSFQDTSLESPTFENSHRQGSHC